MTSRRRPSFNSRVSTLSRRRTCSASTRASSVASCLRTAPGDQDEAAVWGFSHESGREVLTVSGLFITKFAERRDRKEGFIDDRTLALSGAGNADLSQDVPRTALLNGSETSSLGSLRLCGLCDKYTRISWHLRRKPSACRPASAGTDWLFTTSAASVN